MRKLRPAIRRNHSHAITISAQHDRKVKYSDANIGSNKKEIRGRGATAS